LATHKSAEKRARQNKKRHLRNVSVKSRVKTRLKAVLSAVGEKKKDDSRKALAKAIAVIDKAASKGVLHKNTASRKISRLTRKVNQLD
jgi:small subunit ribosomal protein S20